MIRAESEHHLARTGSATPLLQPWSGQTPPYNNISVGLWLHNRNSGQGIAFACMAAWLHVLCTAKSISAHVIMLVLGDVRSTGGGGEEGVRMTIQRTQQHT